MISLLYLWESIKSIGDHWWRHFSYVSKISDLMFNLLSLSWFNVNHKSKINEEFPDKFASACIINENTTCERLCFASEMLAQNIPALLQWFIEQVQAHHRCNNNNLSWFHLAKAKNCDKEEHSRYESGIIDKKTASRTWIFHLICILLSAAAAAQMFVLV